MNSERSAAPRLIRHDIDGLRAISVLMVLFYHVSLPHFHGGFIGVDVFFVISGYLIIPAVLKESAAGTYSAVDFMLRRFRRLIPALIPVLVFALVVALLLMTEGALTEFLESALAASGFVSNYLFLGDSGYFAPARDTVLLLHTWSLGVEFQFYLLLAVLPLIFKSRIVTVLVIASILSLIWAQYLVQNSDARAFFGILPRFWELAFGGLLGLSQGAFLRFSRFGWAMRIAGLCMVLAAVLLFRSTMPFPGLAALLPVVGAGLVVAAPAQKKDPTFWLLTNRIMRWIGTRSYSIYLWHWPLIVTLKILAVTPGGKERLAVAFLAFPLAELSYRFFETPARQRAWWRLPRRSIGLAVIPLVFFAAVFVSEKQANAISALGEYMPMRETRSMINLADAARATYLDDVADMGNDGRRGLCSLDQYQTVTASIDCLESTRANPALQTNATDGKPILILGDSHGRDMFRTLGYAFPDEQFIMLHQSSCSPTAYHNATAGRDCFAGLNEELPRVLDAVQPKLVVLASHWPLASVDPTSQTLTGLEAWGGNTMLIGPGPKFVDATARVIPTMGLDFASLTSEVRLPARFDFDVAASHEALETLATQHGFYTFNRLDALCDPSGCLAFAPAQGLELMNWDDQHLTEAGMRYLAQQLKNDTHVSALVMRSDP